MKLRNKKTGEIKEAEARDDGIYLYYVETEQWFKYDLLLLAEYWEYYIEPKETMVRAKEIREEIKLFAYRNEIGCFRYQARNGALYNEADNGAVISLEVSDIREVEHLVDGCLYTLQQLCGE